MQTSEEDNLRNAVAKSQVKLCCENQMIYLGMVDFCNMNTNSVERWICSKCGRIIDLVDYSLDTEELYNLIKDEDKLQGSEILKDLGKELMEEIKKEEQSDRHKELTEAQAEEIALEQARERHFEDLEDGRRFR